MRTGEKKILKKISPSENNVRKKKPENDSDSEDNIGNPSLTLLLKKPVRKKKTDNDSGSEEEIPVVSSKKVTKKTPAANNADSAERDEEFPKKNFTKKKTGE